MDAQQKTCTKQNLDVLSNNLILSNYYVPKTQPKYKCFVGWIVSLYSFIMVTDLFKSDLKSF